MCDWSGAAAVVTRDPAVVSIATSGDYARLCALGIGQAPLAQVLPSHTSAQALDNGLKLPQWSFKLIHTF